MATYVKLVLAMLFYGVSFVSTKIALGSLGPTTILWIRLLLSSVFLTVLDALPAGGGRASDDASVAAGEPPPRTTIEAPLRWPLRADLPSLALVVLFQPLLYFLAETYGLRSVSAGIASIVIATIPVFTPVAAWPLLGERARPLTFVGLLVSLGGVAVIVLEPGSAAQFTVGGLLLLFASVFAAVGYTIAVKRVSSRYRPLTIVKVQSIMGLPLMFAIALALEGLPTALPEPQAALHLLYLGLFPSSLAFVFLSGGIRSIGASRANVFVNLVPVFTAVTAWALLGEEWSARKIVGMLVVITGVLAAQWGAGRSGSACTEPPRPARRGWASGGSPPR